MAHSLMIDLPAINGIYVTFFQILVYCLTGTSRHISVGTFAIIALMTASSVKKYDGILYSSKNETSNSTDYIDSDYKMAKVKISMALALGVGIVHVAFSILHIGVVTKYLSDSIVNGFTSGAAYQTVTSQIPTLLGISLGEIKLPFVIIGVNITFFHEFTF